MAGALFLFLIDFESMLEEPQLHHLRQSIKPIIFTTEIDEAPYGMKGTAFVIGYERRLFVVMAKHSVRGCEIGNLAIFPTNAPDPFVFSDGCVFDTGGDEDTDQYDWAIVEASMHLLSKSARRKGHLIDLTHPSATDWFNDRQESSFFTLGYPSVVADDLDYLEPKDVNTPQLLLRGKYAGAGSGRHVHRLVVENPLGISDFDGMSGSPVFSTRQTVGAIHPTVFCGMVLRGTASSGIIHFVDGRVLLELITQASTFNAAPGR